jgi:hypothetical protein
MRKYFNIFAAILLSVSLFSCEKEEDVVDYTPVRTMAGDWYVQSVDPTTGAVLQDYFQLLTSCTSSFDKDTLVISDLGNLYEFNTKVKVDVDGKTFAQDKANSNYYKLNKTTKLYTNYNITCSVTEGKITEGTKLLPSGTKADEISFKIKFSDDSAGTIYLIKGYRKTGFIEDLP